MRPIAGYFPYFRARVAINGNNDVSINTEPRIPARGL
jgi:hypothetical protein